jgi:hypothetical protein
MALGWRMRCLCCFRGVSSRLAGQSAALTPSGRSNASAPLHPTDWVRLIRPVWCRLVTESETPVVLYHNMDNGMHWHAEEPQSLEFPLVRPVTRVSRRVPQLTARSVCVYSLSALRSGVRGGAGCAAACAGLHSCGQVAWAGARVNPWLGLAGPAV